MRNGYQPKSSVTIPNPPITGNRKNISVLTKDREFVIKWL